MAVQAFCVGICGATCSGKTSLSRKLQEEFPHSIIISQDNFYHDETLLSQHNNGMFNWDEPQSLNQRELLQVVQEAYYQPLNLCQQCSCHTRNESVTHIVIVEGNMILALDKLRDYLDISFFLTLDEATCRQRRAERKYDGEPDPPGYFDAFVWPWYMKLSDSCHVGQNSVILDGRLSLPELQCKLVTHISAKTLMISAVAVTGGAAIT